MKRIYALLFNIIILSTYSIAEQSKIDSEHQLNEDNEKIKYTIKSGDTLLAIARKYHTTREYIRKENNLKKGHTLSIGEILIIPINRFYTKGSIIDYNIKSGDTLLSIAKKFHTTKEKICKTNQISKDSQLKLNKMLKIPISITMSNDIKNKVKKSDKKIKTINYTIASGDTILGIARKYYSTTKDIIKVNNIGKRETLKLGRVLKIPINTFYPKDRVSNYKVSSEDTINSLAKKFAISEDELLRMNNLESRELSNGVVLKVPKLSNPLTIASVVKDGEDKAKKLQKEKELKLAIEKRKLEEEAILAQAEKIRKARELREESIRKAKLAQEKLERKEQERLAKIARLEAEARAKKKREIKLAKIRKATLEKNKLAKIEAEETKKLLKAQAEAQKVLNQKKEMEEKARVAEERVKELEKLVKERALKVKKKEEEINKIKGKKEVSFNMDRYKPIAKKERVQRKNIIKKKDIKYSNKKVKPKIMVIKKNNNSSILTKEKSKIVKYKVKRGDNLYKIAKAHHTTTIEVLNINHFRSNSDLVIGKMIKVPVDTYFHLKKYTIKRGDTLYKIARRHNTTTTRVLLANNMRRGSKLKEGKTIKVPVDTFTLEKDISTAKVASNSVNPKIKKKFKKIVVSKSLLHHKVKRGETIYSIAKKNNITVKSLKLANKLKSNRDLKIGRVLQLPNTNKSVVKLKLAKKTKSKKRKKKHSNRIALNPQTGKSLDNLILSLSSSNKRKALPQFARKYLGKRYVWGATGPYRFDCSGFTSYVCKKNGVSIPRTSINQSKVGKYVSRSNLKAGDLIFFDTSKRRRGYVNHVGIYIGNNKFIHASSAKKKVVVTSLNAPFYRSRFKWGRRM